MAGSLGGCTVCQNESESVYTCKHCTAGTVYCSLECERENWDKHQATCRSHREVSADKQNILNDSVELGITTLGTTPHSAEKPIIVGTPFRCEEQPIENKGNGMVATEDIPAGTVVTASAPLMSVYGEDVVEGFEFDPMDEIFWDNYVTTVGCKFVELKEADKEAFLSLCDGRTKNVAYRKSMEKLWGMSHMTVDFDKVFAPLPQDGTKSVFGIWLTNSIEAFGGASSAIYALSSKFNHSCRPNVHPQPAGLFHAIVTQRDIKKGEELCTSYLESDVMQFQARQAMLLMQWNFRCKCELCTSPIEEIEKSNQWRNDLFKLGDKRDLLKNTESLKKGMEWIDKKKKLIQCDNLLQCIRIRAELAFNAVEINYNYKGDGLQASCDELHECMKLKWGDKDEATQKALGWKKDLNSITSDALNEISY